MLIPTSFMQAVRRFPLQSVSSSRLCVSTATADGSLSLTTQQLDGIVPYINSRSPRLKGRQLPPNPAQWLWQQAAKTALRGELLLAAVVDKHRAAPYVMAVLAGAMTGLVGSTTLNGQLQQHECNCIAAEAALYA